MIWRGTCEYLKEKVTNYKGVNLKGFGAFTYECKQTLPKLGINLEEAKYKNFDQLLLEKKSRHIMRPCFIIDTRFLPVLTRFKNKEEVTKPASQSSVYQKGINMTYCNPGPIAIGCYLKQNVVEDGLKAIFNALYDLISIGRNICIKTGFCNINFIDKNLTYSYSPEIINMIHDLKASEDKFKWGVTPVQKTWKEDTYEKWCRSNLGSMLEKPETSLMRTVDNKSQMLKIMSLDLSSTYTNGFYKK